MPLKNCSLTVHLEQTPHNTTVEGATFQSVQASAKQSQTLAHMFSQLFPREQQVIRLLGAGFPNKEIGNTLGLSVRTVEGHLACIIHDGSSRNRAVASREGHAEPRENEAYLKQYVEVARGEPARQRLVTAANSRLQQKCS